MIEILFWLLLGQTEPMLTPTNHKSPHYTHYQRGNQTDVQPETRGGFALMGGSTDVDEAFQWMAERGGNGDFLVLRGSGSDGYQEYIDELTEANSVETIVLKDKEAAHDEFVLERVARADAIFLAGGDQWNYVGKWKDTPLMEHLNTAILNGVPLGGTSAGLAVLGEHLFSAEKGTVTSEEALADPYHERLTLESNFLQAPPLRNLITDSHFSERERMGRLVSFMARLQQDQQLETVRGVGVDEKTAVLVEPSGKARTVGRGSAHFAKADAMPEVCEEGSPLTHRSLSVHSVSEGQTFDLTDWSSPQVEARPMKVEKGVLEGF